MNRIVNENTGPWCSLDNDNIAGAILQYQNTPIQWLGRARSENRKDYSDWKHRLPGFLGLLKYEECIGHSRDTHLLEHGMV